MALSRFVLTSTVIVPAGAFTADASTGLRFGTGSNAPGAGAWGSGGGNVFPVDTVIYADSAAGSTGPQLLYQAIGAGNLRPYVQGQDDVGHAGLAN